MEFVEGKYALSDPENSPWFEKKFEQLAPKEKEQIFGYNFLVRQLPNAPEAQLIDIFKRINRNTVSLNKQELRHATYWGEFILCAAAISDDPLWSEINILSPTILDGCWMRVDQRDCDSRFAWRAEQESTLDKYYVTYEDDFEQKKEIQRVFRLVLPEMAQLWTRSRERVGGKNPTFTRSFSCSPNILTNCRYQVASANQSPRPLIHLVPMSMNT